MVNIGLYLIPMRTFDQNSPGHKTRFSVYDIKGFQAIFSNRFMMPIRITIAPCELRIAFIR